jgi:plasmid stabilization system protein ParE
MTLLEWTEPAVTDIENIREYIANDVQVLSVVHSARDVTGMRLNHGTQRELYEKRRKRPGLDGSLRLKPQAAVRLAAERVPRR